MASPRLVLAALGLLLAAALFRWRLGPGACLGGCSLEGTSPDDSLKFDPSESTWEKDRLEEEEDAAPDASGEAADDGEFKPMSEGTLAWQKVFKMGRPIGKDKEGDPSADRWNGTSLEQRGIPNNEGVHVITTFFKGNYHERRFKEIMSVLVSNLENPSISAVHLLCQDADPREYLPADVSAALKSREQDKKLVISFVTRQPTYRTLFEYVNKNLQRGAIAVVTNADIYFGRDINCVVNRGGSTRVAIALSRRHSPVCRNKPDHHSTFDLCQEYVGSHDTFILSPPIPKRVVVNTAHTQNQGFGAENIVIYELRRAGFRVLNPCYQIHGFHLHCSPERHYALHIINKDPPRPGASYPIKKAVCPVKIF